MMRALAWGKGRFPVRCVAILAVALGLVGGLTACGGGEEAEPIATAATTATAVAHETIIPDTTATVGEPTETPVATADSKYDEAWARKQVEPYIKERDKIMLAQEWNKLYDLVSDDARAGCSRSAFVSKMAGVWLLFVAFGGDEILKAEQQDLEEGKLSITFSEITPERITYTSSSEEDPSPLVREDGKWKSAAALEQDCASLDVGATPTPEP